MQEKDNDTLENFEFADDKKSVLKEVKIEKNHKDLVHKSCNTKSHVRNGLSRHTTQAELLASELSSFLTEIKFSKQEFFASKPLSDIKYYYLAFSNNNVFFIR